VLDIEGEFDTMSESKVKHLIDENTDIGDYFKETFEDLWNEGYTAREIAKELQFDDVLNTPWEGKLKVWHVYYFASKWKLKKRNIKSKSRVC